MCDVLCGYPASTIYPANYRPCDDNIARRRLNLNRPLASSSTADAATELALDPDRPLVVGVLDGVTATPHRAALAVPRQPVIDRLVVQSQRGGHILRMRALPDLTYCPDPQRLKSLVIELPAVIVPHGTILPDHTIRESGYF